MPFAAIGEWLLSKLSFKSILIVIVLALAAFGCYKGYSWIYEQGAHSKDQTISDLQAKVTKAEGAQKQAEADLAEYKRQYNKWVADTKQAQDELAQKNDGIVAGLNQHIAELDQKLTAAQKVKNELSAYISKANDSGCVVPNGFVLLYNRSLSPATAGSLLALPGPSLAYAPSGLSLTDVAGVFLDNNSAAVKNRELVLAWQAWYNANATAINAYLKHATNALPPPSSSVK